MTYKQEQILINLLGYIPTADEWEQLNKSEPGLVKLILMVLDRNYESRTITKEIY